MMTQSRDRLAGHLGMGAPTPTTPRNLYLRRCVSITGGCGLWRKKGQIDPNTIRTGE